MPKRKQRHKKPNESPPSQWPRYWAIALCVSTFLLLWVGGLVTSTHAGMAVPDWPTTYGYNMFLYPLESWLKFWDVFIEHFHRLLASFVGLVTIVLLVLVWRNDRRAWLRWLTVATLALVILQGVLGGVRVTENDRAIAMIHGCTGPLFFALTTVLVAVTSPTWGSAGAANRHAGVPRDAAGLLLATAVLAYIQLTLGAQLRHVPEHASPWAFAGIVKLHLLLAAALTLLVSAAVWRVLRAAGCPAAVRRLSQALAVVLIVQITLGIGTWLLKYGAPGWAAAWLPATIEANVADGWTQTHVVTAHSACGSLLLGLATLGAALAIRTAAPQPSPSTPTAPVEGHAA